MLEAPEHQKMNGEVKVTWRNMRTISQSLMFHARVLKACIHFALMYTTDHTFPVLPIKYLTNKYGKRTTSFKLAAGTKTFLSRLCVLFFPCVVQKATAHFNKKALNMRCQAQKGFYGIFSGIPQHQKGYLLYVPSTRNIIY